MTSAYNHPSLTDWAQTGLAAIYTASSEEAVHTAVEAFFSPNVEIHLNEEKLSREEMRQRILDKWHAGKIGVKWENVLEVPREESEAVCRIEQDPSVQPDEHGDRRRVTYLYETEVSKRPPIHLHSVAQPADKPA
ncbi:hypothetical protein FA95DRAFT_1570376 [Auriscalpium vulgare]|uniref:Uncharacterized protein n=1 Tax=Auriscalpium vulgare TaxID=40419 RepID=A0ACB8S416_9AGAM|nr:hypothetical protein FA95DRAFT_1570376 [Auriscalpium vulgare]